MKRGKVSIGGFIMIIRKHFLIPLFLLSEKDLTALSEMASELKARADAASAYGEKIGRLTDGFDFDGLLNLAVTLDKEQSAGLAGVMGTHTTAS